MNSKIRLYISLGFTIMIMKDINAQESLHKILNIEQLNEIIKEAEYDWFF